MSDEPQYVEHRLIKAIAQDPGLGELEVDVAVDGMVILLSGRVASERHRRDLLDLVGSEYPRHEITDKTEIVEVPPPPSHREEIQ